MLKSKIPTPSYTFPTNSGALPGLISSNCPDISHLPLQLVLADIYHMKEIIDEYKKVVGPNTNALLKYLGHSQDSITIITTGIAGEEKVTGHSKDTKLELKQKDTSSV